MKYEILNVSEIKSTDTKLIVYKRKGTNVIEKTISNSKALENLTIGEYEFKFNSGVITSVNKVEN